MHQTFKMEKPLLLSFLYIAMAIIVCYLSSSNLILSGHAAESPQYTVVYSESDFEIRLYRESSWMSALIGGTSFEDYTKEGFHRLYQYTHGANLNSSRFAMTAPVLTSITPSSSHGSIYYVRIYMSAKYQGTPPHPNPELNLQLDKWRSHCVAVRKFSGFAKDDNINKEIQALVSSLNKSLTGMIVAVEYENSYSIAQYNASFHLSGRLNEVWINVSGFTAEGCPPSQRKY